MKDWFYNEAAQVGVDYGDQYEAAAYDERMERFRDYDQEARDFLDKVDLPTPGCAVAIDMGCGTGAFAVHAARYFRHIHAADVSPQMLGIAKDKALRNGVGNVTFHEAGFLGFTPPQQVDIINTKWVLHHLPDYWKQAALLRMNEMLKSGGILLLTDWVFTFKPAFESAMTSLITRMKNCYDNNFVREAKGHIQDEFSTFDWMLEGMIERAGFTIEAIDGSDELATEYLCRKTSEIRS